MKLFENLFELHHDIQTLLYKLCQIRNSSFLLKVKPNGQFVPSSSMKLPFKLETQTIGKQKNT